MLYLHINKPYIMKNEITKRMNYLFFSLFLFMLSPLSFAQDGLDIDVDISKDQPDDWMSNPLYWVIGALVVLLIIAIIARGRR